MPPDTVHFKAYLNFSGSLKENRSNISLIANYLGPKEIWPPLTSQKKNVSFKQSAVPVSNDDHAFAGEMVIGKDDSGGTWRLEFVDIVDKDGIILRRYEGKELEAFKGDIAVKVGGWKWLLLLVILPLIFFGVMYVLYNYKRSMLDFKRNVKEIYIGKDGVSSTSKAQFLLWTVVVIYAYVVVVLDGFLNHGWLDLTPEVPDNLLMVMGLASLTALGAKGITTNYKNTGLVFTLDSSKGGLLLEDDGYPSLAKIQLAAWNLIASGIFLAKVLDGVVNSGTWVAGLNDIDSTLLVLIGIGDASYLGKKISDKEDPKAPRLTSINPNEGGKDESISITGINFGKSSDDGLLFIEDREYKIKVDSSSSSSWNENMIKFKLTGLDPELKNFSARKMKIGLRAGELDSVNDLEFELKG